MESEAVVHHVQPVQYQHKVWKCTCNFPLLFIQVFQLILCQLCPFVKSVNCKFKRQGLLFQILFCQSFNVPEDNACQADAGGEYVGELSDRNKDDAVLLPLDQFFTVFLGFLDQAVSHIFYLVLSQKSSENTCFFALSWPAHQCLGEGLPFHFLPGGCR